MNNDIVIARPDTGTIEPDNRSFIARCQQLVVTDKQSHEDGLNLVMGFTQAIRKVEELFAPSKKASNSAHKEICAAEKKLLTPLKEGKALASKKCGVFEKEQEKKAEEEQRALEAKAREEEEDRRMAEAEAAEDEGNAELAEEIINEETVAAVVSVAPEVAQVEGVSSRKSYKAVLLPKGLTRVIQFVAQHPQYSNLLKFDQVAANALARSQREQMQVPGVKLVVDTVRSVRT